MLPWRAERGAVLVVAETLGLRAGEAVVAVDCDQRFTWATSLWADERRRGRCDDDEADDGAWWWVAAVWPWGFSALAATLASPWPSESEAARLTVTADALLMEPARDGRRRCCVPGGLLGAGSTAASLGALMLMLMLMLVAVRLLECLRPRRG